MPNGCRTSIPEFHVLLLAIQWHSLVAGPQKIQNFTPKWVLTLYIYTYIYIYILRLQNLFVSLFKRINWRKTLKFFITIFRLKTVLAFLKKKKKYQTFNIKFYFLRLFFNVQHVRKVSAFFLFYKFLRSLWFFENENFDARVADIADFRELNS